MPLATVPIHLIYKGQRLRDISEAQVEALSNSIGDVGLLNPITVYRRPVMSNNINVDGYGLVAGAHRLEACKRLGLAEIDAQVVELSDLERQIAECDENLCAANLSKAERALFTRRRKEAYEALHPETRNGGDRRSISSQTLRTEKDAERFTADTAAKTGQSERAVQLDAERGKISETALNLLSRTPLDRGAYLDALKEVETEKEQVAKVKADLQKIKDQPTQNGRSNVSKIDADVKARAAKEVAEIIAEFIPGEWWDNIKSNLYAAGAKNIANELTNITGQSIMDRSAA